MNGEEDRYGTSDDITCTGVKSIVLRDDISAKNIALGSHLKLWRNSAESNLWIDRFDVRNELDVIELKQLHDALSSAQVAPGPTDYMLDESEVPYFEDLVMERFQDLLDFKEEDLSCEQPLLLLDQSDCIGALKDVTEGNSINSPPLWGYQSDRTEFWVRPSREPYVIPLIWDLPSEIKLPMTKKQFDVIVHTVKNIRNKGSQFEILLKLKESDTNPIFDFLNNDCDLNELFEHIKRIPTDTYQAGLLSLSAATPSIQVNVMPPPDDFQIVEEVPLVTNGTTDHANAVTEVPNALSLLGHTYGEDSSSDTEGDVNDLISSSENCISGSSSGNLLQLVADSIEIADTYDSDCEFTASTASFPSESPRTECSEDPHIEISPASVLPLVIATTEEAMGSDQEDAVSASVFWQPTTTENEIADALDKETVCMPGSTLDFDTVREVTEDGEINESEDESELRDESGALQIKETVTILETVENERYSADLPVAELDIQAVSVLGNSCNQDVHNSSELSVSPDSVDADTESDLNIGRDDKDGRGQEILAQTTSYLELTKQLSILETEVTRLHSVDDDLLDDDVDKNDFWGITFTLKTRSIEQLKEIAGKRDKIVQLIDDVQAAMEVQKKKADRLKRVKLLRQQFEEKAALAKIEAQKIKDDDVEYNVLDAVPLRDDESAASLSEDSSSCGEKRKDKVRSRRRERQRSSSTDSSRDSPARHRRKYHVRDREKYKKGSRERDRKKKSGKEKDRDRERKRDHVRSRVKESETYYDLKTDSTGIKKDRRERSDVTAKTRRKRPSSESRSPSRSPMRSRRNEEVDPGAAPTGGSLDFKSKIRVALGVEPLTQPVRAVPVPFRDRIQLALDALK